MQRLSPCIINNHITHLLRVTCVVAGGSVETELQVQRLRFLHDVVESLCKKRDYTEIVGQ